MNAQHPPISRRSLLSAAVGVGAASLLSPWFPRLRPALAQPAASAPAAGTDAWPLYRGNPQLHGVTPSPPPTNPKLLWTYDTRRPGSQDAIRSSPILADGRIYIGADDGHCHAVNPTTGQRLWAFKTDDIIEAPPTFHNGAIYIGSSDGFLYKLAAATGELLWKFETGNKITAAANTFRAADGRTLILLGSHDAFLYALDAETGRQVWSYETTNFVNAIPAVENGLTVFGGCDGFLHLINIADGSKVNQLEIGSPVIGATALDGSHAYLGHHHHQFLDINLDPLQIAWTYEDRGFPFATSPALTADSVIFGGDDRRLHCVNRATGERRWVFSARRAIKSSPVVAADKIVVGSEDGRLYIVNLADGQETWSYDMGKSIVSSPAVAAGLITVGCDDGKLYTFAAAPPATPADA